AAERTRAFVQDEAARCHVICEGIVDDVARPDAGCEEGAGALPWVGARAAGLPDRARRHVDPAALEMRRIGEAAKGWLGPLHFHQLGLAQDGKPGERVAARNFRQIVAGEPAPKPGRRGGGPDKEIGQLRKQRPLTLARVAGFQRVEMGGHRSPAFFRQLSQQARGARKGRPPAAKRTGQETPPRRVRTNCWPVELVQLSWICEATAQLNATGLSWISEKPEISASAGSRI